MTSSFSPIPSPLSSSSSSSTGYFEHLVSKFDTLAGIAIKYGVEVSDIKRLNGLVTDREIFAHQSLRIPLPGRHPPSPILSNSSVDQEIGKSLRTPPRYGRADFLKKFQSLKPKSSDQKVSPAMRSLQGYYGLFPPVGSSNFGGEGAEMAVYRINDNSISSDEPLSPPRRDGDSSSSLGRHWKSRSLVNDFPPENGETMKDVMVPEAGNKDNERSSDKSVRRRPKVDDDLASPSLELILKEDSGGVFLGRSGKGLALRPKSASRSNLADCVMDLAGNGHVSYAGDPLSIGSTGVQKSSSTSNLQDSCDAAASSWSASKWALKPDLQALSAVAIAKPIFDGLPKPITGKRNKAALD